MGNENGALRVTGNINDFIAPGIDTNSLPEGVTLLPRGLDGSRYVFSSCTLAVLKLFKQGGVKVTIAMSDKMLIREERDASWFGPIIFFGLSEVSQNPDVVNVSLGIISNYLTDIFKGDTGTKTIKITCITEDKKGEYSKFTYDGPLEGLDVFKGMVEKNVQHKK